jgi:hypothetical protein
VVARRRPELFEEPRGSRSVAGTPGRARRGATRPARRRARCARVGRHRRARRVRAAPARHPRRGGARVRLPGSRRRPHRREPRPRPRAGSGRARPATGLAVHRVAIADATARAGTAPPRLGCSRRSATGCRCPSAARGRRRSRRCARHLDAPVGGLPHPSRPPDRGVDGRRRPRVSAARSRTAGSTGTPPPVPRRALLVAPPASRRRAGHLHRRPAGPGARTASGANSTTSPRTCPRMREPRTHAPWRAAGCVPPPTFDAYYDLTEAQRPRADAVWPYAPPPAGACRDVALDFLATCRAARRPAAHPAARVGRHRGGSAPVAAPRREHAVPRLDALFRWPTPVLAIDF